jgi:hypothetical protein
MGKKRKKISAAEEAAFDERTKLIREFIARHGERVAAEKAARQGG